MPPKPKYTKEEIIDAAVDIIRSDSIEAITAQEIAKRLGTSTRPMFTYFATVDELRRAAGDRASQIYDTYIQRGLHMMPPYKGYALEHVRFSADEPNLFKLLFMQKKDTPDAFITPVWNGYLGEIRKIITDHFGLTPEQSDWLHRTLSYHAHGMASLCACGVMKFDETEISQQFGDIFRALMIYIHVPKDARTAIIPAMGRDIPGAVDDYLVDINIKMGTKG